MITYSVNLFLVPSLIVFKLLDIVLQIFDVAIIEIRDIVL